MGDVTSGYVWASGETVTPTKLNQMLGDSVINTGITQLVSFTITELDLVTAAMPAGAPTITDGVQFFSGAIVPASVSSKVELSVSVHVSAVGVVASTYAEVQISIFRGSTWICTRFVPVYKDETSGGVGVGIATLSLIDSPASASSVAYSGRVGGASTVSLDISINNIAGTSYGGSIGILKELVGVS